MPAGGARAGRLLLWDRMGYSATVVLRGRPAKRVIHSPCGQVVDYAACLVHSLCAQLWMET